MNRKEPPEIELSSIRKILLIRLRRIGDIIMTTPAISVLRENFPQAFIAYVVNDLYRLLVEGNPNLDEIIVLHRKKRYRETFKLIRQIRRKKFDLVLDFHCGPRASLITFLSRSKLKIGYRIKYRNFVYNRTIPRGKKNGYFHSVENHINLVDAIGIKTNSIPPLQMPETSKEEQEKLKGFIKENNIQDSKMVVLHIGAGNKFRDWGTKNQIQLINLLGQKGGIKIVLIGGIEDRHSEKEILKNSNPPVFSLVGKLNLRELRELISLSSLFVGPDSGPMHIAATTPTPIVAYFGPTLAANFAPWKARALVIEKDLDCRPCRQKTCLYEDFRCLQSIKPEEVSRACLRFI